jgi:outer membrane receptor protein involved in Fe transport
VAAGGEFVLDWRVRDNLGFTFTYSYLDLDVTAPAGAIDGRAAEGRSPVNQASVRVNWDVNDRFALDATVYYVDDLEGFGIDEYVRSDLRAAMRLGQGVRFELVGQNLFDNSHREFTAAADANAAEIGRSVFGRLTWRP